MNNPKRTVAATVAFILAVVGIIATLGLSGCSSCSRMTKSVSSDFSGGMERTVTLYDNAGNKLKSWHGKIDLASNDQEVFFDLNGKRVIIQGGIVVSEEFEIRHRDEDAAYRDNCPMVVGLYPSEGELVAAWNYSK